MGMMRLAQRADPVGMRQIDRADRIAMGGEKRPLTASTLA
jgi:hypothetical protein